VVGGGALDQVDHLVYVTRDVEATIEDLNAALGVRAAHGGRHPAWGTRNALLSLGPRTYLEIMGPDGDAGGALVERPFGVDGLERARLATWAVRSGNLQEMARIAAGRGVDLGRVLPGQRSRADGSVLSWTLTDLTAWREGGAVPFFIDWGMSRHPAEDAPPGCQLKDLRMEHPDPARIGRLLEALGLEVEIGEARSFRLFAVIGGRNGEVVLS
jgi:hypothetical protein